MVGLAAQEQLSAVLVALSFSGGFFASLGLELMAG